MKSIYTKEHYIMDFANLHLLWIPCHQDLGSFTGHSGTPWVSLLMCTLKSNSCTYATCLELWLKSSISIQGYRVVFIFSYLYKQHLATLRQVFCTMHQVACQKQAILFHTAEQQPPVQNTQFYSFTNVLCCLQRAISEPLPVSSNNYTVRTVKDNSGKKCHLNSQMPPNYKAQQLFFYSTLTIYSVSLLTQRSTEK